MKALFSLLLLFSTLMANEAEEIIQKLDNNMRGKDVYMKMSMQITSLHHERNMKMESYSKGKNRSFIKILYPPKEKGITFLSLDGQMWNYIPKIERVIKIPPSMMLQNWMGSDISNDDMVKQSSIVDDYIPKLLKRNGNIVTIELQAKEDAPVVWDKIISIIDTTHYTGIKDTFYDESAKAIRTFEYAEVKQFGTYFIPTIWKIKPINKKNNITTLHIIDAKFDEGISDKYFNKNALKRFSR